MHQRCARQPRPLGSLLLLPIWGPPAASHSPSLAVPYCWSYLGASPDEDLGEQGPAGHTMGIVARARCPWWVSPSCHPLRGPHQQCGLDQGVLSLLLPTLMIFFFHEDRYLRCHQTQGWQSSLPGATSRCHPRPPRFPVASPGFRSPGSPRSLPPFLTFHPERPRGSTIIFAHLKVAGSIPLPFRNVLTTRSRRSVGSARAVALRSYKRPWASAQHQTPAGAALCPC